MMRFIQNMICCALFLAGVLAMVEARPQNSVMDNQDIDNIDTPDVEGVRNSYYDLQAAQQPIGYPSIPMDRLQMLIAQYRPTTAYLRAPTWNGINDLYRMPESKRQVRYRQCYFNPISCFKK